MERRKLLIEITCCLFIILFLYTAVSKLMDYEKFKVQLGQSPILTNIAGFAAWAVPSAEIGLALLLVIPKTRVWGLYGSFSIMIMFTAYIVVILNFSGYIPCSCGGVIAHLNWSEHLVFNITLTLLAALSLLLSKPEELSDVSAH